MGYGKFRLGRIRKYCVQVRRSRNKYRRISGDLIVGEICWACDGEGYIGPFFHDCPNCGGSGVTGIEEGDGEK